MKLMELNARITELEFVRYDYIRVRGFAHSKFNDNKICGSGNEFNLGWFWPNGSGDGAKEIKKAIDDIINEIKEALQFNGTLPKQWPGLLAAETDDGVFTYKLNKFVIQNPNWNISNKRNSYVEIVVHSRMHNEGKAFTSTINLRIAEESSKHLFKVLDENL